MDNQDQTPQVYGDGEESFTLEDILREWAPEKSDPPEASDTIRLDTEKIRNLTASAEGNTTRFVPLRVQSKPMGGDTVRMPALEDVSPAQPAGAPEPAPKAAPAPEPAVRPEPIPGAAPVSRPAPAPRKPVPPRAVKAPEPQKAPEPPKPENPEKTAAAAARGLTSAYVRLMLATVIALGAAALTVLTSMGIVRMADKTLLPFIQMALLLLVALLTYDVVVEGLLYLFRLRLDPNALLTVGLLLSAVDGFQGVLQGRGSYGAYMGLGLAAGLWAICLERQSLLRSMKILRLGVKAAGLRREKEYYQKKDGVLPGPGDPREHMERNAKTSTPERVLRIYGLLLLVAPLAASAVITKGGGTFLQYWTAIYCAGCPLLLCTAIKRPWARLSKRLEGVAAVSGWSGAAALGGKFAVPVTDEELYPTEQLQMNGVKFYGDQNPDHVISCAAAVINAAESGLAGIFEALRASRGNRHYVAQELKRYDNGGLSAQVGVDSVMLGSPEFLRSMGVELPAETKVSQAVYVALNSELSGVFAISFGKIKGVGEALTALCRTRGVTPVFTVQDFFVTDEALQTKFRLPSGKAAFPPRGERAALAAKEPGEEDLQCALLAQPALWTVAKTVVGARSMRFSAWVGTILVLFSGILGMGLVGLVAALGATEVLSGVNVLLYGLVWAVPIWLFGGWASGI